MMLTDVNFSISKLSENRNVICQMAGRTHPGEAIQSSCVGTFSQGSRGQPARRLRSLHPCLTDKMKYRIFATQLRPSTEEQAEACVDVVGMYACPSPVSVGVVTFAS